MSADLTQEIEKIASSWLPLTRANLTGIAPLARAIAALIAEREAAARRQALEEAARLIPKDLAEDAVFLLRDAGFIKTSDSLDAALAAIRSLAAKEATNDQ